MGDISGIGRGDSIKPTGQNFSAPESPELKKTKQMQTIIEKSNPKRESLPHFNATSGEGYEDYLQKMKTGS